MTIVEFIKARLDEDEQVARAATRYWHGVTVESATMAEEDHVRRYNPARVLREVEAKRRILEAHLMDSHWCPMGDEIFRALALPYSDHPDYDEAWRS